MPKRAKRSLENQWYDLMQVHDRDVDLEENKIFLFGREEPAAAAGESLPVETGIDFTIANRFLRNLHLCEKHNPQEPLQIEMKSCGGYWEEGMAIYDAIKRYPAPVAINCHTHARSMTSVIFQAADYRFLSEHGSVMIHTGTKEFSGTAKEFQAEAEWACLANQTMFQILASRMVDSTQMTYTEARDWLISMTNSKENVYLNPENAVRFGLADGTF